MNTYPQYLASALEKAHPSWKKILADGLDRVQEKTPGYFGRLENERFLPTDDRLFAAFSVPLERVRYVLVGEGPYPREESASGYCFMDGAVRNIWSENGLSKEVNRATSLRNFVKMLLVADGVITPENSGRDALGGVAADAMKAGSRFITTMEAMKQTLLDRGFLLLNAALVFRPEVAAAKETRIWQPFLEAVLEAIADASDNRDGKTVLILWGKMAEKLEKLPATARFHCEISEHPYNISFIRNQTMQKLFGPLGLLYRQDGRIAD